MALDIPAVRVAKHGALAQLLLEARDRQSPIETTWQIHDAVRNESLPPAVVSTWLSVSQSDDAIAMALKQDYSCIVREKAIVELSRKTRRTSWESIWNTVGGVEGMLRLFADFSVLEIKQACSVLGRRKRGRNFPAQERCIEQLLRALIPFYQHTSSLQSTDERPLLYLYARLVPGCSTSFVSELFDQNENPLFAYLDSARIVRYHPTLLQKIIRQFGFVRSSAGENGRRCWSTYPRLTHDLPTDKRDTTGFSPIMRFLLELLDESTNNSIARLTAGEIVSLVSTPLLRLAIKNKVAEDRITHIINATLKHMERRSFVMGWSSSHVNSFLYSLATYWSRKGATKDSATDNALANCLQLYGANQRYEAYDNTAHVISDLFPAVSRRHRYALLRHVLQFFTKPSISLDDLGPGKSLGFDRWSCRWFIDMNPSEALDLLKRLISCKEDQSFLSLWRQNSILSYLSIPGGRYSDPGILLTYLSRGQEGALIEAENITHRMQKKSATSREQADRAFFAESAMFYAIASGSMALYHEVIIWSRRYLRDPMTVRVVFGSASVLTTEGIDLLSGMYNGESHVPATATGQWQVAEGNRILLELFDLACTSLKEPSFNVNDWEAVKSIYRLVIERRLHTVTFLQRGDHTLEKAINENVWRDTIDTLVELERIACKPEHERLRFNSAAGPLSHGTPYFVVKDWTRLSSGCYLFLDKLAEARDELWKVVRSSYSPATVSLGQPWPKGLPVQYLVPFNLDNNAAGGFTPYISSRAGKVVFISELTAGADIPRDKETRSAIGGFVDSYGESLKFWISQLGPSRDEEITRAWQHAMKITRGRMDEQDAVRFWRPRFQRALPFMKKNLPMTELECQEYPLLPRSDDEEETQEWNPASNQPAPIKCRPLSVKAIDCLLGQNSATVNVFSPFNEPRMATLPFKPSAIWEIHNRKEMSGAVEEGLIASALLYIDSTDNKGSRILAKPFPSSDSTRFPPLILDPDFLLNRDRSSTQATEVLRALIDQTPSSLLDHLVNGILSTSTEAAQPIGNTATSTIAYQLLALSTKSDQPHKACDLILRTIIGQTDTSAWHRQFLSKALLYRLPAINATQMLMSFVKAIETKLNDQAAGTGNRANAQQPAIKVTTVKYLAQLLNETALVSPRKSLNILVSLFQKSTHRDVHYAIAESILAMLANTAAQGDFASTNQTLQALQDIIPVVGRLNERIEIQAKDWIAFSQWGKIPIMENQESTPPLFGLLLDYAVKSTLPEKVRRSLVQVIILPAYESSKTIYNHWVSVLLSRYGVSGDLWILRSIPPRPVVLAAMLRRIPELMPDAYIMEWHNYVKANLVLSPELSVAIHRLAEKVKCESTTSNLPPAPDMNPTLHWTRFLDQRSDVFRAFSLAGLVRRPRTQPSYCFSDKLISLLQKLVLEQADILIENFDKLNRSWSEFLAPLRPHKVHTGDDWDETWARNCAPILESIVQRIESYRDNPRWQVNPDRKPQFLPSSFDLRLALALLAAIKEDDHTKIAKEVSSLLENIITSGKPYHHEFDQIKSKILTILGTVTQVNVACFLGELENSDEELSMMDFLQVDLAHWLLRKAHQRRDGSDTVKKAFKRSDLMLDGWRKSEIEELRMRGAIGFDKVAWADFD
ncbi:MAG: hypothetical protein Q9226_002592 [Calogaya cf. arnoldii]